MKRVFAGVRVDTLLAPFLCRSNFWSTELSWLDPPLQNIDMNGFEDLDGEVDFLFFYLIFLLQIMSVKDTWTSQLEVTVRELVLFGWL